MEDRVPTENDFLFPWEYLADFYLTFRKLTKEINNTSILNTYDCCLSRVRLSDYNLLKKSDWEFTNGRCKTEPGSSNSEDLPKAFGRLNLSMENKSDKVEGENSLILSDLSKEELDALQLPKYFGQSINSRGQMRSKKRRISEDEAKYWLRNATFEEYWESASCFLIYKTWLQDYGDKMSADNREELERNIISCKPIALLEEHDSEMRQYWNLTKSHPLCPTDSYEKIFEFHCELVKNKAAFEFSIFRSTLTNHRCKNFLKKIENMGFVPGYSEADFSNPLNEEDQCKTKKETTEKQAPHRRSPVVYGEDEVFNDVSYNIYESHVAKVHVILDKESPISISPSNDNTSCSSDITCSLSESVGQKDDVTFAFNPETDAHLIAKEAFKYYKEDSEILKYWYQRYRLFSKLDHGIIMDREGWFSVTPERIAEHIADRMVRRQGIVIVDAFAGVGGNSIQLAKRGAKVIAIDLDPVRLKCAKHNAKVYGVEDNIEFICCDFFHFADTWTKGGWTNSKIDGVFLSPPWGGPSYLKSKVFDLNDGIAPNGFDIYDAARIMSPNIAYFLPRNTSIKQLISLAGSGGRCEIEQSCLNRKIKTITAYYGDFAVQREDL